MRRLEAGSLVRHRTLGTGKVVAVEATALHVFFPGSDTRFAAKLRWPAAGAFLSVDAPEPDPSLEALDSFAMDATSGRYALAAGFVGQDEAVSAFLAEHPAAFLVVDGPAKGAPRNDRRERWRAASALWAKTLGGGQAAALLEDGEHAELARRALRVAGPALAVHGMMEPETLAEAFQPGPEIRDFLHALVGYLAVPLPARARFDKLCAAVRALGTPPDAAWPLVTFFPFVASPARHVLLLPRSACAAAARLGCDLRFEATPNWATYVRLRDLSSRLLEKLAPSGARDHVDVESFLHATGTRRTATTARRAAISTTTHAPKARRAAPRRAR